MRSAATAGCRSARHSEAAHARKEAVPSTESCDTMTFPILFAFLVLALAAVAVTFSYRGLAALRARRRAAWELDRVEWRRWIVRA